jgi:hypothetical protein
MVNDLSFLAFSSVTSSNSSILGLMTNRDWTKKEIGLIIMRNSKRWFWVGVVLFILGIMGWLYFGLQVLLNKVDGIMASVASDSPTAAFVKFDCPWALDPGEIGVVTAVVPVPSSSYSIDASGTRLDVKQVTLPAGHSQELQWEITAQGNGSGLLVVEALSGADRALPGPFHFWPSSFRQGCSVLATVLGLPYKTYLLICLFLTVAGVGDIAKVRGDNRNRNLSAKIRA